MGKPFPLTRPIARRRAQDLFDLCAGFVYSQVLQACVQLRLFETLVDGPQRRSNSAPSFRLSSEAACSLFEAAVALELTGTPAVMAALASACWAPR